MIEVSQRHSKGIAIKKKTIIQVFILEIFVWIFSRVT